MAEGSASNRGDGAVRRAVSRPGRRAALWVVSGGLLGALAAGGCAGNKGPCGEGRVTEACVEECGAGKASSCRALAEAHLEGRGVGKSARVGAMFLERACQGADTVACEKLAALPIVASARRPAAAPPPASLPAASCPLPPAASSSAPAVPAAPAAPRPPSGLPQLEPLEARCFVAGDGAKCTELGDRYAEGLGVPQDTARAIESHELGCQRGDVSGCRKAGWALLQGSPGEVELGRAAALFQRGCVGADVGACLGLGEVALTDKHPTLKPNYGATLVQRACANNHPAACRKLALLLLEGKLLAQDEKASAVAKARSLELVDLGCQKGAAADCQLLGLWRESPDTLGERPDDAPRTSDQALLDAAFSAYKKACEGGLGGACYRAVDVLAALGRAGQGAELIARVEGTCTAGDPLSCVEVARALRGAKEAAARAPLLARACEMAVPRACLLLGQAAADAPALGDAGALLERACKLGSVAGCEEQLARAQGLAPERRLEAHREVCMRVGGAACVALARAVAADPGQAACALDLAERACFRASSPSPAGCLAAADLLRSLPGLPNAVGRASVAEELACSERSDERAAVEACARVARALDASKQDPARKVRLAEQACKAGVGLGCLVQGDVLARSGAEALARQAHDRACLLGERAACERLHGSLPELSAPAAASALPAPPPEPGPLACSAVPSSPGSGGLWLAVAALFVRRRRS